MPAPPTLDAARLAAYLDAQLGSHTPIDVRFVQGGASNEVFAVDRGQQRWVLRRPPSTSAHASAHDVLREYRFLSALHGSAARVPKPVLACADATVLGSPFYLMERIEGAPIRHDIPLAYRAAPAQHARVGEELIDALAEIHSVDYELVGLSSMGKPEGFLARQAARWKKQLESYRVRDLPYVDELFRFLSDHVPPPQKASVMHGDYKTDNVLYSLDLPPRLLAVVDWELASIGDPLLDLAWCLFFWPQSEGGTSTLGHANAADGLSLAALPSRRVLAERYARVTGRNLEHLGYYVALAGYKLAVIIEGNYARFVHGQSHNEMHQAFEQMVPEVLERAWHERGGY